MSTLRKNRRNDSQWAWLGMLVFSCLPLSPAASQQPQEGVLLLKETDRVMAGKIVRRGEFYEVELAASSRVSIPAERVAHHASTLEELYAFKRRSIPQWNIGDHFQLTRWCMANGLLAPAAEHYLEVARRQPDHPRVKQLGIELKKRLLEEEDFREYLGLGPQQSAAESGLARTTPPHDEIAPAAAQSLAIAPQLTRSFAERIQPILMNRCGQAACHGAQSRNGLRLLEPYAQADGRITTQNLRNVLDFLGDGSATTPPLLRLATTAHGVQRRPAIELTETELLQELQIWIRFAHNPVVPAVASDGPNSARSVRVARGSQIAPPLFGPALELRPVMPGASGLREVPRSEPAGLEPQMLDLRQNQGLPTAEEIDALDAELRAMLGDPPASTVPTTAAKNVSSPPSNGTNPFDPAEFNRGASR